MQGDGLPKTPPDGEQRAGPIRSQRLLEKAPWVKIYGQIARNNPLFFNLIISPGSQRHTQPKDGPPRWGRFIGGKEDPPDAVTGRALFGSRHAIQRREAARRDPIRRSDIG
jgi:hypothetical protein